MNENKDDERTKDMKLYSTYEEEPKEFNGEDMKVHVTKLQRNDKFQHRGKGWVTVTDVEVRRTRVKVEFVDAHGKPGKAFPTMELQEDVPIVRQTETDEHKLWRLERELHRHTRRSLEKAKGDVERWTSRVKAESSLTRGISLHGEDLAKAQAVVDMWDRYFAALKRDPESEQRPYRRKVELDWIKHDPATAVAHWYKTEVNSALEDSASGGRSYRSDVVADAVDSAQLQARASELASSWTGARQASEASNQVLALRSRLSPAEAASDQLSGPEIRA